ncbi:glycosyl transferase [Phormidesmis priestleyi ULC007]|uniref:Glycosyl transferase n=2 Tax=Phormidesmis priestleyi TaxID=268141 RepID=A0A2T1DFT9_9CYAN|nr:glycosyl transferase [Phormidesmis priestleyi ULC007]PZO52220.1 MAG: glycosyl transferase [Phormidesmis priestleyi]
MSMSQLLILGVDTVLYVGAFGILFLSLILLTECIAALFPTSLPTDQCLWQDTRVVVLVPAHNEAMGIRSTLVGLLAILKKQDRLVVIADNCSDATAEVARAAGAIVIERQDLTRIGKGYALDYGLRFTETDPPDVVVIVDADCQVEPKAIETLTQRALATGRPMQATYLMEQPSSASPKHSISAFAFKVKNLVRPSGLGRLGLPCLLTGTGMAFPWSVIGSVDLASSHIVEDMKLGLDLTIAGYAPVFCSDANVTGRLPQHDQAAETQRTRWEHGHLQSILTYVPVLLKAALQKRRFDLLALALDLCVPPLSLLVVLWIGFSLSALVATCFGASWIPTGLLAITGLVLISAIFAAWAKFGRADLPLRELLAIPFYILWKVPLYFNFLIRPQKTWVRTERDQVNPLQSGVIGGAVELLDD